MKSLKGSDKEKITRLLKVLLPSAKIYLFGSRARGTNSPRSDIDIAIDNGKQLPLIIIGEVQSVISATNVLYKVDIVDINSVSKEMKEEILNEGIVWAV